MVELHSAEFPVMHCQPEGLWYKFKLLHTKKINTGDPHHPHEIHHAKDIMKQIEEKMDAAIDIDNEELGIHDPFMRHLLKIR